MTLSRISVSLCFPTELQMQLEKKQDELITKTAEMEELLANPRTGECTAVLCDQHCLNSLTTRWLLLQY